VRRVLGLRYTRDDLEAIEARRHAAFVVGLAPAHAALVAGDRARCERLALALDGLTPATVAERVVLESVRSRLRAVPAPLAAVAPVVDPGP
jgi:hypothetical protein